MSDPNKGMVKIFLPGESLWALPVGKTYDGRLVVKLRNASIHGIPWDTVIILQSDGKTVAEPEYIVELAEDSVRDIRRNLKDSDEN